MAKKAKKMSVEEIVHRAVNAFLVTDWQRPKEAFKETERALYAIPVLEKKIAADWEALVEMKANGLRSRSLSIVRFQRSGYRIEPEELLDAMIQDLEAKIAADEYKLSTTKAALETFQSDPFFPVVTRKYIDRFEDEDIAKELGCGTTQVWKQRTRIVRDIAVMLHGTDAL